jgi:hypothetical protein
VYFGTSSPGAFQGNQTATTFDPGAMANDTTYYWRIDEVNAGGTTTGTVWSFTTIVAAPAPASSPSPADSAVDVSITADLSWSAGSGATSRDVYFGTSSPGSLQGNQTATTFDPGTLDYDTTYYWRIDEINVAGTTTGTVWNFTTLVTAPTNECDNWQSLHPEWIFCDDFETEQDLSVNYNDRSENGMSVTTNDPFDGTYSLEQEYSIGQVDAGWITKFVGDNPHLASPGDKLDEIYYRFYHKFEDGFTGLPPKVAQTKIFMTPSDWTGGLAVYQWIGGNDLLVADIKTYDGSEYIWLPVTNSTLDYSDPANIGTWICIEVRVKLNTVGQSDGEVQYWADGQEILYATDLNLQAENSNGKGLNMVMWNCYWNSGSPVVQSRFYDNLVISTAPIGGWVKGTASNPNPADNDVDTPVSSVLSWTPGDYADTHDVYLGTDVNAVSDANQSSAEFMGNVDVNSYDPCGLDYSTTYYWAIDEVNDTTTWPGDVWSFTTEAQQPPAQASSPSPADSAVDVSITATLSWTAGAGADSHDVYFGTTSPGSFQGNQTATTFDPGTMDNDTTYYWRIDEVNGGGTTTGNVWSFTTIVAAPGQASNPSPADSATDVSIDTDLSWTAGAGSTSSDVYFGTTSPGAFQGNQTATTFDPGTLNNSTTYYWRIDEKNTGGTTTGVVWSFTTIEAAPGQASNPAPTDSATNVNIDADLSWTAGTGATSHDVYFGTTSPGTFQGNQTATTFDPGTMDNDTTYYWRIDEVSVGGTTTGVVWSFTTVVSTGDEIIGWWELNDASGSTAVDSSTYGNDGTLVGSPAWTDDAERGWCLDFPGNVTDYVAIPNESFFDLTGNMTVMAWMRASYVDWRNFSTIIAKGRDGQGGWALHKASRANAMSFWVDVSGMPWDGIQAGVGIFDGQWHHVAGVYDGSDAYIYVDGGLDSNSVSCSGSIVTNDWDVYIGLNSVGMYRAWEDLIDDVRVYNYALSQSEINDIYTGGPTPPGQASNPSPADSATDVSINADLSWTAGADTTSHDVYFGTSSPGAFQSNQTATTFDPGTMSNDTTYYWRIDEINAAGTTTGTVWSFTTEAELLPPGQASNPSPADSATDVSIDADLSWTAGADTTSHDVYFGTSSPGAFQGNQTTTTFDPGTMANDTTYYWRIDEINAAGTTTGNVWSFTTIVAAPGQASNPSPADSATDVSINADLSWTAGADTTSHDVYFGTSSPGAFQGNQTATTFDPGTMSNDTTYYWRIDEINAAGTTTGNVWSFTTIAASGPTSLFSDGFESGDLVTGGWTTSGDATVTERSSYTGAYGAEVAATSWMEKAISTAGFASIHVKYVRKTKGLDSGEYLYVEWYDGGAWNPLESTQDTSWLSQDITCPSGADNNADFKVRFRTNANKGNEYAAIDDVEITGTSQ